MELRQDPLLIRSALSKDAAQLAAWWNDGAVMAHAGFPNGIGTDADTVQKQLFNTDTHRFIVEFEGIPIGEMCYRKTAPATAEIGIKICSPAYQNRGLGKALLRLFIDALFKQGFSCIEVIYSCCGCRNRRNDYRSRGISEIPKCRNIYCGSGACGFSGSFRWRSGAA